MDNPYEEYEHLEYNYSSSSNAPIVINTKFLLSSIKSLMMHLGLTKSMPGDYELRISHWDNNIPIIKINHKLYQGELLVNVPTEFFVYRH